MAKRFLSEFFGHWTTAMTGTMSIPFAVAAALVPTVRQSVLFIVLAIVCFVSAFYQMWLSAAKRVEELLAEIWQTRPIVVPEVETRNGDVAIFLANAGRRPALGVAIASIHALDGNAEFETVQVLRTEDGRMPVTVRTAGGDDLRKILARVHLAAALSGRRADKGENDEFMVPIRLRYTDELGAGAYEDDSFEFCWLPTPRRPPTDMQLTIRRRPPEPAAFVTLLQPSDR